MKSIFLAISVVTLSSMSNAQTFSVACDDYPPFNYMENNEIKGDTANLVKEIFDQSGVPYQMNIFPWARVYSNGLNQENTCIFTLVRTQQREPLFEWVGRIQPSEKSYVWKLKSRKDINIKTINDMEGLSIGVLRNSMNEQALQAVGTLNIFPSSDHIRNIKKLFGKRLDVIVMEENNLNEEVKKTSHFIGLIEKVLVVSKNERYLACSKNSDSESLRKLREALNLVKKKHGLDY